MLITFTEAYSVAGTVVLPADSVNILSSEAGASAALTFQRKGWFLRAVSSGYIRKQSPALTLNHSTCCFSLRPIRPPLFFLLSVVVF